MIISSILLLFLLSIYNAGTSETDNNINEIKLKRALNHIEQIRYDRELNLFIELMGHDESRHDWTNINIIGCMGEFQFKQSTLKYLGYSNITRAGFKEDPNIFPRELQREVMLKLIGSNITTMQTWIDSYQWTVINDIIITKAGILAACHLAGPTGVKKYLSSGGHTNRKDIFNTSVETYLKRYQGFNLNQKIY